MRRDGAASSFMEGSESVVDVVVQMLEQAAAAHARSGRVPLARSLRRQARRLRASYGTAGPRRAA